jgi:SAM-dependent methyltransferase
MSMYPTEAAVAKHNLLSPRLPPQGRPLHKEAGFETSSDLFGALQENLPTNLKSLGTVYSYPDAPKPPLSRDLLVIGFASRSLPAIRKLVGDEDEIPDCLHKCIIAVKRADDDHKAGLNQESLANSTVFASLVRRLQQEDSVAIVGRDKYNRFGIIKPIDQLKAQGSYRSEDFMALCYVGTVDSVKSFVTGGASSRRVSEPSYTPNNNGKSDDNDNGYMWEPPKSTDNDSNGLWQPPGVNTGDSADNLWEPPSQTAPAGNPWDLPSSSSANNDNAYNSWQDETNDSNKRKRDDDNESTFHKNTGAAAADEFYSKLTRNLDTRAASRIFHMRAFNGWVKGTQIAELNPTIKGSKPGSPLRVLDLACGKGGDLGKWVLHSRGIGNYVGSDVARGSLMDAAIRARNMKGKLKRCTFTCADLGADVPGRLRSKKHKQMQKLLTWSLQGEKGSQYGDPKFEMMRGGGISQSDKFDVVSIQFAIHYMMQTRKRARRFFQTVSELLEIGGNLIATTIDARVVIAHLMNLGLNLHFDDPDHKGSEAEIVVGGGACKIKFEPEIVKQIFQSKSDESNIMDDMFGLEYSFTLIEGSDHAAGVGDAVNLPEWLTPIPVLTSLAREAGLELEYAQNFHEFFAKRADPNAFASAHTALYNMKVLNRNGSLSGEEWEISRLYVAVKFRKVAESRVTLDDSDDEQEEEDNDNNDDDDDENDDEEEEEDVVIDPVVKAKLMPQAMMKAKSAVGNDKWKGLTPEEKTKLIEAHVRKLVQQTKN